jgi:hypothetical protein
LRWLREVISERSRAVIDRPSHALETKSVAYPAKTIRDHAQQHDIDLAVADEVSFDAFGHDREAGGPATKLPLQFRKMISTT